MKFHKTLTIFLIVNSFVFDLGAMENLAPQTSINATSVTLTLPLPSLNERQKYIINTSDDNGLICHNFFREKEIKNKLFELQTKVDTLPELENKLLEKEKPVSLISGNTVSSVAIGAVLGLITGFFIAKK